jgi:catechol 2,3-dioxygenase-like lactoylglutathione lyase family enzyme
MTDKPVKIAFVVADIPAAVEFYTRILDLRVKSRYPSGLGGSDDFVFLSSATIDVELLPQKAMGGSPVGFHHLAFRSDHVETHLAELKVRGAVVISDAFPAGVGGITLGDFTGPGGVLLRLFNQTPQT